MDAVVDPLTLAIAMSVVGSLRLAAAGLMSLAELSGDFGGVALWRGLQPASAWWVDSSRPFFPTPTEHVGKSADAAGKSACATSTVTQICEAQ
jgi:hypothetical protein